MIRDRRGRLTIPGVVEALAVFFFIGALWPVVYEGYQDRAPEMSQGVELLVVFILPLSVLVLYFVIVRRAVLGVGR